MTHPHAPPGRPNPCKPGGRALLVLLILAGCANPETRARVTQLEDDCAANDQAACDQLPAARQQAQDEANSNARDAAGIMLDAAATAGSILLIRAYR